MKRILIIEDNLEIAELERDFLEASAIESVIERMGRKGWNGPCRKISTSSCWISCCPGPTASTSAAASVKKRKFLS